MSYVLMYTLQTEFIKPGEEYKEHRLEYDTRKDAESAAHMMRDKIYWHKIVASNPASKWPKVIVSPSEDLSKTHDRIEGVLDGYFETGMECLGLTLYDLTKLGPPNPDYDASKPEDGRNFKNFRSHEGLHFIEKSDVLEYDGYRYSMVRDRDFALEDGFRLSLYPAGYSKDELLSLFHTNKRAVLWKRRK